jgi:putative FmdB family regulatory protein
VFHLRFRRIFAVDWPAVPIYEYRCANGHTFEVFQRMSDPPAEACEICGVRGVEKVLYPVAVHFKGSGFYSTDYGRGSRKTGKDAETGSGEKSDTSEKKATKESKDAGTSSSSGGDSKSTSSE